MKKISNDNDHNIDDDDNDSKSKIQLLQKAKLRWLSCIFNVGFSLLI